MCGRVTYNTLIDALVRAGDMSRAGELFRDMTLKNVTPDTGGSLWGLRVSFEGVAGDYA